MVTLFSTAGCGDVPVVLTVRSKGASIITPMMAATTRMPAISQTALEDFSVLT